MTKAIVLMSGGLDSTVILAAALQDNRSCLALSFDYGQRHLVELEAAKKIAAHYLVEHRIISIDPQTFKMAGSSLVSKGEVGKDRTALQMQNGKIPSTYVPARNTLFIAYAIGQAEIWGAEEIHLGPNKLDKIPYPDCRPEFIQAFQQVANLATKQAAEGHPPKLVTPLLFMDKREIVQWGRKLNAPLEMSFSCYDPVGTVPCERCDACLLRAEGFRNL